ncbi:hypothetical protein [Calothrix sp. PCC 7507]|uniref:hypothetical protein n=1 Tax=Calothrix sp. PCC 7507 TaxID=99598 RepID=UPI00029F4A81|nr:hypothetical protein [Calothrix sp. PCC 7507]AFY36153.1 hypothetical protein Cal7507_5839 [Calothrix sp. PCC 7507]
MIISDLSILEVVDSAEVVGGGKKGYTYYENDRIKLDIYSDIDLDDNAAVAFADSKAYGNNSFSKTVTYTKATGWSSDSSSASFAAVD